ncbi:uncharacterized protein [Amphiura filiformis]|uniref:uncharacterized protein n=1 Tax=Amphiura filiformis TaxID=82378 RepID=UPI003B218CBF
MLCVFSCSALLWVQICVNVAMHTCCAEVHRVIAHGENGVEMELSISSQHCQSGWFQYWPSTTKDISKYNVTGNIAIVCKRCSKCTGVRELSPCTETKDVECSKMCYDPELIYHESTKSCRGEFLDDIKYGVDITGRELPGGEELESQSYEEGELQMDNPSSRNNDVQPMESIKDPNVLFVASGVIFVVLIIMVSPQAINKVGKWLQQHGFYGNRDTDSSIERTFAINGGTNAQYITLNHQTSQIIESNTVSNNKESLPSTSRTAEASISDSGGSDLFHGEDSYDDDDDDSDTESNTSLGHRLSLLIEDFSDPLPRERYCRDAKSSKTSNLKGNLKRSKKVNNTRNEPITPRLNSPEQCDQENYDITEDVSKCIVASEYNFEHHQNKDSDGSSDTIYLRNRSDICEQSRHRDHKTSNMDVDGFNIEQDGNVSKLERNYSLERTTQIVEVHVGNSKEIGNYEDVSKENMEKQSWPLFSEPRPPETDFDKVDGCMSDQRFGMNLNIKASMTLNIDDSGNEDEEAFEATPLKTRINNNGSEMKVTNDEENEECETTPLYDRSDNCESKIKLKNPNHLKLDRPRHDSDSGLDPSPDPRVNNIWSSTASIHVESSEDEPSADINNNHDILQT